MQSVATNGAIVTPKETRETLKEHDSRLKRIEIWIASASACGLVIAHKFWGALESIQLLLKVLPK